jgi:hypothetical protein
LFFLVSGCEFADALVTVLPRARSARERNRFLSLFRRRMMLSE